MSYNLKDLADKRDALFLAEIAAWLHMLGKFHEGFLEGQHGLDIEIPPGLQENFPQLNCFLKGSWSGEIWDELGIPEFQASSLRFLSFIKEHRNRRVSEGLLKLMWDSHGRGSGIEKGVLNRFAPSQTKIVYLSTAFGTETDYIDCKNLDNKRHCLYNFLQTNLESLKESLKKNLLGTSSFNWQQFRSKFIFKIENYFRQTVAETRRPLSDVTLFDQTFASVAFLKAALAQNLLLGWKDPITDKIEDKYHWRFLRVGLDGLAFWSDAVRIGDLLARKQLIKKALDTVKNVIEEDYPLGLEVYRDENGSLLVVPDVAGLLDEAKVDSGMSLRERLQEVANHRFDGEVCWTLELSDRTRNTLKFGRLAATQPEKFTASSKTIAPHWIQEKRDICPVCSLRPISSEELKICTVCQERRTARAKEWNENLSTTIWIDEVADTNGRIALIVGRFDLESWLTGESFNSIVSFDPEKNRQLTDTDRGNKKYQFDYQTLLSDIEQTIKSNQFNKKAELLDDLVLKNDRGGSFQQFYDSQVTDTDLGEGVAAKESFLLALAMMRQNPSFARLRRVWESIQKFWQKALTDSDAVNLPKVKGRLIIESSDLIQLQRYGNYDLVLGMTKLSVLHGNDKLITIDNLRYVAKQLGAKSEEYANEEAAAEFVRSQLLNQQISLEEPTGYGSPNKLQGKLNIGNVTFDEIEYSAVIQILAEPRTFMALVPAEKSLDVIKAIKTKYDREMGKVCNRLPLHLGVVYFDRRTPLRSALDAGRQMLTYKSNSQKTWQVHSVSRGKLPTDKEELANGTKQFNETITLELMQDNHKINWHIPVKMGDGLTDDNWYPYVFLETNGDDSQVNGRQRAIKSRRPGTTTPCWLVHAGDLKSGDKIYFTPSTFDFEYLDTSTRRFEIYYDENGRRPRHTRPFYLEDLDRFDTLWKILKNLEKSQRYQVIHTIEATRDLWYGQNEQASLTDDHVFRQFVTDTLANAAWTKEYKKWTDISQEHRQQLIDAGVRCELADLAELHMEILKER